MNHSMFFVVDILFCALVRVANICRSRAICEISIGRNAKNNVRVGLLYKTEIGMGYVLALKAGIKAFTEWCGRIAKVVIRIDERGFTVAVSNPQRKSTEYF